MEPTIQNENLIAEVIAMSIKKELSKKESAQDLINGVDSIKYK